MPAVLYLTPTTDAILAHIAEHVHARHRERPLAPLTLLLPSGDAIRQMRRVLDDVVAVRFVQLYNLSAAVLAEAGSATHEMSDLATRRVVRGLLSHMDAAGQVTTFGTMLDKPGFIDVLVEWLREMKTQGITPQAVAAHAERSGKPRDAQLAALYARYQDALHQADCADADGLLWLAAEKLEADAGLSGALGEAILAGFDQFSPVQLRLVSALADRLPLSVYLLWDGARPQTSLALGRLAPTRAALLKALSPEEVALPALDACGPTLVHVRRSLFEPDAQAVADEAHCIRAIAAPSPESEVRHALRAIKQLLLNGARHEQIALLAPQPGVYRPIVAAVGREYGTPVACETTLGENACISALLNLLALAPSFPWRQTFDALRSPYIRQPWLSTEQIALLDALTRQRPVLAGREQWQYALTPADRMRGDTAGPGDDEDRGEPLLVDQLPSETLDALRAGLEQFFAQLTPPQEASQAGYVAWMQNALLGLSAERDEDDEESTPAAASLGLAQAAAEGEWAERDTAALQTLLKSLRTWLDADALATSLNLEPARNQFSAAAKGSTPWQEFAADLLEWLPTVPVRPDPKTAAVRFGPLDMNRAVSVDHLFVLGLGEGEFPRQPAPDPFYTVAERAAQPLPLAQIGSGEDASLWWQVLCNCQCSLTLLRSRYDKNGAVWEPSAYWTAVVNLVEGLAERIEQPGLATRPTIEEAASYGELVEALALRGDARAPEALAAPWGAMLGARAVAQRRDSWGAPGGHEGVIADETVLRHLLTRYGPERTWSVSRLNRYGVCAYQFWAKEALGLQAMADPAEGFDAMQRGSLVHKILEKLFGRMAAADIAPCADTAEDVRRLLDKVCDEVLPGAAERYGFRPGPLWEHEQAELRAELQAYMTWECLPKQAGNFRPFRQELQFGMGQGTRAIIPGPEGSEIRLRGVIDRIDTDGAGHLRVIDYKTGSKEFHEPDILTGRALQSALYAWVVETMLPEAGLVVHACYRHTGSREASGDIRGESACEHPLVQSAAARAVQMASAVVRGWFAAAPSRGSAAKACDEQCDYLGLCRATRHGVRKAQRAGTPPIVGETDGGAA